MAITDEEFHNAIETVRNGISRNVPVDIAESLGSFLDNLREDRETGTLHPGIIRAHIVNMYDGTSGYDDVRAGRTHSTEPHEAVRPKHETMQAPEGAKAIVAAWSGKLELVARLPIDGGFIDVRKDGAARYSVLAYFTIGDTWHVSADAMVVTADDAFRAVAKRL